MVSKLHAELEGIKSDVTRAIHEAYLLGRKTMRDEAALVASRPVFVPIMPKLPPCFRDVKPEEAVGIRGEIPPSIAHANVISNIKLDDI